MTAVVKQGGTVPLFLTIGTLQAPKSQAAFCAVVRDITQWKKTESELREAKERAEATSRQKSEFLAASAMNCARRSMPSWDSRK